MERRKPRPIAWSNAQYFVCPFVIQETLHRHYCLLCNCTIYNKNFLIYHIRENYHKLLLDYHSRYITPLENDLYACSVCNCVIPRYTNVNRHLNAKGHGFQIQRFEEKREYKKTIDYITAKTNEFYNRLQDFLKESSRLGEKREEKGATNNVKAKPDESNNDCSRFEEKREEKGATNNVKAKPDESNNDCSRFEEKREEKDVTNNEKGKANKSNNDCSRLEEKREEKDVTNNEKAKANKSNNNCSRFEENRDENVANNVKTKAEAINDDCSRLEKKRDENVANNVKAKSDESNDDSSQLKPKRAENVANNVKAEVDESNGDCSRLEEHKYEKSTIDNVKIKTNASNDCSLLEKQREKNVAMKDVKSKFNDSDNDCSRFERQREEKVTTICEEANTDETNDYCRLEVKRKEKRAETDVKANANDINDDHEMNYSLQSKGSSFFCSPAYKDDVVSLTPQVNESFQYYSIDNFDQKILAEMAYNTSSNDTSSTQDSGIEENALTSTSPPSEQIVEPKNAEYSSTKTYNQTFVDLLDFQSDMYDLRDRIKEASLAMDLCFQTERGQIYCLVCHEIVANASDISTEHLCSLNLCEYRENIMKNGENSFEFTGEFGKLNLASQYMEYFSVQVINCLVCKLHVRNFDFAIQNHVRGNDHCTKVEEMRAKMRRIVEKISSRWLFDWYKVQKYSCTSCSVKFQSEFEFAKHLNTEQHTDALKKAKDLGRTFVYDFCGICAIFWCGYRDTYASHCDSGAHKWIERNGQCVAFKLSESTQQLLNKLITQNDDAIDSVYSAFAKEDMNKMKLVESLGNLKLAFPWTKGCAFGSRVSSNCVIDVFLGCEKMNDGRTFTEDDILYYMMSVNNWMSSKPEIWKLKPLATGGRSPIISAIHKPTDLACDISFDNRLVIGGLGFIDAFDQIFPSCCKLMDYLGQWLAFGKLTGSQRISSYVLYWLLVFYLQKQSILPSVVVLTQTIDGLQVGGSNSFVDKNASNNVYLKKLLIGFFNFYANFDFRHDVACPLIGKEVKKRSFAYPENLPIEMGFYTADVMYSNNPEEFPVDSPMCIQDPFSLNHNLSKNVSKLDLSNFRTYCAKTATFFSSS